jgi:Reverse transcriptase (RNA-dependent DNA polymerase)/GIY-YIG catalytic domain
MQSLPSYLRDSTDFLSKLKECNISNNSYLVTLDVSSLYTNIPHEDGINACRYFLENNRPDNLSVDSICDLIKVVLENNHFQFNGEHYLQKMGTAMGSAMAPSYASLFMGKLEHIFLEKCVLKPALWLRFLDDIFVIWNHSLESLHDFIDRLNNCHNNIKFTYAISKTNVSFLDVDVIKNDLNQIVTDVHVKNTNIHQFVEYSSCHPVSCKNGIPLSQAKRYRRIISDNETFDMSLEKLRLFFKERNYPDFVVNNAISEIKNMTQDDALLCNTVKEKKNVIPFVVEYNTSLPNIGQILHKYWDLLKLSPKTSVKYVHSFNPIMAYKRPKNLKDFLVKSRLDSPLPYTSKKCNRPRCSHCSKIVITDEFKSSVNSNRFKLKCNADCSTKDVIYLITCKKCAKQYVGQTRQKVSQRMNSHKFDIKNFTDPSFATSIAVHFNNENHCFDDFSFLPIEIISDNMERLLRETFWIHKLETLYPKGLNTNSLYKV